MNISKELIANLAKTGVMLPQEEMLEVKKARGELYIGIPKETSFQETRVALTPAAVAVLVNNGHRIVVETDAGKTASFQDKDYSDAGAQISYNKEEVFRADIILKVAPPSIEELGLIKRKQTLISALNIRIQNEQYFRLLMDKKLNAISYETIKDEDGTFPVVRTLGEIAGNTAILIAAEYLSNTNNGQGMMFGGISGVVPTEVVIIGAGTAAETAARAALGLGASVKVFDNSIRRLRRLQNNLGRRVFTSVLQPDELQKALSHADVAIGALQSVNGRTPCVVTENMVSEMKYGSVVIDISIDQGGCFETSEVTNHQKPTYRKYGVIHYCVPNIASRVAKTASNALSNVFTPMLIEMGDDGGLENFVRKNHGVRNGLYVYNGVLTSKHIGESYNLPFKEIDLLMAAF